MLWDLFHLQPVYDIPSVGPQSQAASSVGLGDESSFMFNNFSSTVGNRRYHVAWSPCLPAVISTCSFDRSVQFYSLSGAKSKLGRAPKWLRKPVGASFGFGGKLATFDNHPNAVADTKKGSSSGSVEVKLYQVVENPELVTISNAFQEALTKADYPGYCSYKAEVVNSHFDRQIWELMKIICFEKSAREGLLKYLGFDANDINAITNDYIANVVGQRDSKLNSLMQNTFSSTANELTEVLASKVRDARIDLSELVENVITAEEAEPIIRQALVIGNFSLAVNCCIEAGLMTEALLLAQCGDNDLWLKTQQIYFERTKHKKFFLGILQSIIKNELMEYVESSDLSKWKETLAILSTYGKSEEFPVLCEKLGERLYTEQNDLLSSTLCYMCAININQTIANWIINLKQSIYSNNNNVDIYALQEFIEKVIIYTQYNSQGTENPSPPQLSDECMYFFTEYSKLLASQGKTNVAAKYLKSNTLDEQILRDRIYHSEYLKPMGSRPPPFPFESVVVNAAVQVDPKSQVPNQVHAKARGASIDKTHQQPTNAAPHQKAATHVPQATQQKAAMVPQAHQQGIVQAAVQSQAQTTSQQPIQAQQHIPVASPQTPQLPPGWLQLVDPSSGRPYYVDQATGQSQWDPPAPITAPLAPVVQVPQATMAAPATVSHSPQLKEEVIQQPQPVPIASKAMPTTSSPSPAAAVSSSQSNDSSVAAIQNMFNELQGTFHNIDFPHLQS